MRNADGPSTHNLLLKNAGVSEAVARDIVGHDSAAVSRLYTHIDDKSKREAVNKLPAIGEAGGGG